MQEKMQSYFMANLESILKVFVSLALEDSYLNQQHKAN
jgi:hypothetical protein